MPETGELSVKDVVNIKEFTKTVDPEGRKAVATSMVGKRTESLAQISSNLTQKSELSKQAQSLDQQGQEVHQALTTTVTQLGERQNSVLGRFLKTFRLGDKVAGNLQDTTRQQSATIDNANKAREEALQKKQGLEEETKRLEDQRRNLKGEVDKYYESWRYDTLTPEQKKDLFKPENLKSLSTEEYLELWRRGSPYFLSHVTRQGFRDHNAMIYHSGGMQEFSDGFTGVLKDEHILRSPLHLQGLTDLDDTSITAFLDKTYLAHKGKFPTGPLSMPNASEAKEKFLEAFNHTLGAAPSYPDRTAVHLAAQRVLDGFYGAERGNEIFFIFPADFVASQFAYAFNGREKDFTNPQSEDKWNDVFAWTGEYKGISVDAGFVFIPEDAKVDPETGSRYASKLVEENGIQKRVMVEDPKAQADLRSWLSNNSDKLEECERELKVASGGFGLDHERTRQRVLERIGNDLSQSGLGKHEAWIAANNILQTHYYVPDVTQWNDSTIVKILQESGGLYKKPDSAISSKDYWEKYFSEHPDQKPAHVMFYSGDPTTSVYNTLQKEGIAEKGKKNDPLLGFEENHSIDIRTDPRTNEGYETIMKIANDLIDQHYNHALPLAA